MSRSPMFELPGARITEMRMREKKPSLLRIAAPWDGPAAWKALGDIKRGITIAGQVRLVRERRKIGGGKEREHFEVVELPTPILKARFEVEVIPVRIGRTHGATGADVEYELDLDLARVSGEQAGALETYRQLSNAIHETEGPKMMECEMVGARSTLEALLVGDQVDAQLNLWDDQADDRPPVAKVLDLHPEETAAAV